MIVSATVSRAFMNASVSGQSFRVTLWVNPCELRLTDVILIYNSLSLRL